MTDILNILDQVQAKAALQSTLAAAGAANALAMEREQAASREHDRLSAQLSEVRATIARHQRSPGPAFADDEDLAEREAELARRLEATEAAMESAESEAGNARETIRTGMRDWLEPVQVTKSTVQEHMEAIAAATAEIERIDSASAAIKEAIDARQAARAAEGARYQEGLSRFLASQALGEIPQDAAFEPPPAGPDDAAPDDTDSATLSGLAVRRGEAVDRLATLQSAMDAIRASVLHQDLTAVLRDYAPAAAKEEKLRRRANALRSLLEPYEVNKPNFVPAPLAQPPADGVHEERDRLAGTWPALWATSPH